MKIQCPVCGIEGSLEVRGNSKRVSHYKGYVNGKSVYVRHSFDLLARRSIVASGAIDAGSNPASPTNYNSVSSAKKTNLKFSI